MKRYIKSTQTSDFYNDNNDPYDELLDTELPDDDGSGNYFLELYKENSFEPIYKDFYSAKNALNYAKQVQARFQEIYLNRDSVNGPVTIMTYRNGQWEGSI